MLTHASKRGVGPWLLRDRLPHPSALPPLAHRSVRVLPYLGDRFVRTPERRYRVQGRPRPGWHRFLLEEGSALSLGPADAEGLDHLPLVRGHLQGAWLFTSKSRAARVHLLPGERLVDLSPCLARRLPTGELIFDVLDLDTDDEVEARDALDEGRPLPAGPPSLRQAYGFALLLRLCRRMGIQACPWGLREHLGDVAVFGKQRAVDLLSSTAGPSPLDLPDEAPGQPGDLTPVAEALSSAGATLVRARRLGEGLIEVHLRFLDRPFVCVVDLASLRVLDAGVCLDGADQQITLACLPAVLREAIVAGRVVVTRR